MPKVLIGCCVMMLSTVAFGEPATAPAVTNPAASSAKAPVQMADDKGQSAGETKICRNVDAGFSHRTERVCMTAKQWEEYDRGGS